MALQYGYNYDVSNGVTPYSASQTSQHTHKPTVKVPSSSASRLVASAGLQPALKAGLSGSVLWSVASGTRQPRKPYAADLVAAIPPTTQQPLAGPNMLWQTRRSKPIQILEWTCPLMLRLPKCSLSMLDTCKLSHSQPDSGPM